jgi:serine/threonine protein kinase
MKIDPESWPTLSRLLDQWLDLPEESRDEWMEKLGPEYAGILPVLRKLVLSKERIDADSLLNTLPRISQPADSSAAGNTLRPAVFTPGALIGPYRLVRELGQGGMGVVWLAERADGEVKRPVALKLPIVSLHNRALAERFARERDILAQLTHPNIARLYDAGVTDQGQPYLAIEFVEGEKITSYCDQRSLSVKARLQLFLQVLRAVQYAHTNLIVHRDLKPANILVTTEGEVRLLDFGIAKLLTEGEANETELTRIGGRALTPEFASPEQIAGGTITTASDVYSLGVILYELLTGERRYKLKWDTRSGLEEAILGGDPVRPSQMVDDQAKAQARATTPNKLARALKGDLDTIALKALCKPPQNRYATADAFAQDIERYLAGEAVLAQPESAWYRAGKFMKRNKLAVGASAAIAVAVAAGMGISLYEAQQAQRRFAQVRELANRFVFDFEAAIRDTPGTLAARRMVAATGRQYLGTLVADAGGDPALTGELAEAYYRLSQAEFSAGETAPSTEHLQKALDLLRGQRGGCCRGTQQLFLLINALSALARNLESPSSNNSLVWSTEAVVRARSWLDSSPREMSAKQALVTALIAQGSALWSIGRLADARRVDGEALQQAEVLLAADAGNDEAAFDRVQAGHSLSVVERELGDFAAGWETESKAIKFMDEMLKRHPDNIRWCKWRMRMQSTAATLLVKLAENDSTLQPQVLPSMRLAYQLAKENVARNPGDNKLVDDQIIMADRLAAHLALIGRPADGLTLVEESRSCAAQLVHADPTFRRNAALQATVVRLQGRLLIEANRLVEADKVLGEAERYTAEASKRWPDDMELMDDHVTALSYRVTAAMKLGDLQAAREHCRLALSQTAAILRKSDGKYSVTVLAELQDQARQLDVPVDTLPAQEAVKKAL